MGTKGKAQVIIEEGLKEQVSSFTSLPAGSCGIIAGQNAGGKWTVCHFIRASKDPPSSDYAQEGEGDNGAGEGFGQVKGKDEEGEVTWVLKRERIFYPCRDLKDLTAAHLPSLALQTARLLPGGMRVLGIFLTTNQEIPKTARSGLRDLLMEISSTVRKDCPSLYLDPFAQTTSDDLLILAFDPRTKLTITSLSLDAGDAKSIIKPVSVAFQKCHWLEVRTRFRVNLEKPTDAAWDVEKILKRVMDDFILQLQDSHCLFSSSDKILAPDSSCPHPSTLNGQSVIEMTMLLPFQQKSMFAEDADEDGFEAVMASGRMVIRGDVIGRAYIAPGSTVATAQKALKADLLRSMRTRIALHCEDYLVTDSDEQELDVVHELPRRILAPLSSSGIMLSNYLHEGESIRDSLEVFVGLLDMPDSLNTGQLLTNLEHIPNQWQVDSALESVSTHSGDVEEYEPLLLLVDGDGNNTASSTSHSQQGQQASEAGRLQTITAALAVLFAVCFALYQLYLWNGQSGPDS